MMENNNSNNKHLQRFGPLGETKQEVTDRLRAEGRWEKFAQQRDELRRGGMSADAAWAELVPHYQPDARPEEPETVPPTAPAEYLEALAFSGDFDPLTDGDVVADVRWAYHNFGQGFSSPPPSPGAVEMLRWAKSNRTAFFKDVVPKLRAVQPDEDRRLRDDGRKFFDIIQRFRHANKIPIPSEES